MKYALIVETIIATTVALSWPFWKIVSASALNTA